MRTFRTRQELRQTIQALTAEREEARELARHYFSLYLKGSEPGPLYREEFARYPWLEALRKDG